MEYITNESKDVKVRTANGIEKWMPKHLAEDKFLMKGQNLEIVYAPLKFEPSIIEKEIESKVAEVATAKRGRPSNK